jgi:integrase
MRGIITVALHTGMRLGEILNLKHADLDFLTGVLTVRDSKNGESRHIPMDSTVLALFKSKSIATGADFVFPSATGGRWSCNQKAFRKARARAELADLHFHDLRHTFASQWMMNGGDLYALKGILGHKSIAMTQRYAHLSPAYQRAMVDRMEAIWAKRTAVANTHESSKPPHRHSVPRRTCVTAAVASARR